MSSLGERKLDQRYDIEQEERPYKRRKMTGNECESSNMSGELPSKQVGEGPSGPPSRMPSEPEIGGGPTGARGDSTEIEIHELSMGEDSTGTRGSIPQSMVDADTPSGSDASWGEASDLLEPDSPGQISWRSGFFLLSFICAVGASMAVSRSYDCKILKEIIGGGGGCASQAISLVFLAMGCWFILTFGLFTLHLLVTGLNELARRNDVGNRRLRSFLSRLSVEAIRIVIGIVCLVVSTTYPDKVPKKDGIAMAACLLGSMTCSSLAFMEHDRFGEHAAVGAIFLGVVYICTHNNFTSMFLGAICCFTGQILLFLWKQFKIRNRVTNRAHCAHLLRRLVFSLRQGGALDTGRTLLIRRLRKGLTLSME